MPDIKTPDTPCSKCGSGNLTCKFNHFSQADLEIHAWEHKCLDCGNRETTAYRNDDEDLETPLEARTVCPYCSRTGEV